MLEAIKRIRRELDGKTPLIGFAGAPFTLASYLIEGGKSSQFAKTKRMMYGEPELWGQLMTKLSEVIRRYLHAQIDAGAQAVQLFDSWVGQLSPADYRSSFSRISSPSSPHSPARACPSSTSAPTRARCSSCRRRRAAP